MKSRFGVFVGCRQGGQESPCLFNYYFDYVLKVAASAINGAFPDGWGIGLEFNIPYLCTNWEQRRYGRMCGVEMIRWILYVDDVVLFCKTVREAEQLLTIINETCKGFGLTISFKKTKTQVFNDEELAKQLTLFGIGEHVVENVREFLYLGQMDDPLWSARVLFDDPQAIKHVHLSQLESGSDVAVTASYQASIEDFCKYLGVTSDEATNLMKSSVTLARGACNEFWENQLKNNSPLKRLRPLVAGSVGPYGACQHDGSEYNGNYVDSMTVEELMDWHRPRMAALVDAGVDLLALETIPAQKEAEALAILLNEFPGTKAWLTFTCSDGQHTSHGEELTSTALSALKITSQIIAVGMNCCSPLHVKSLLVSLKDKVSLPLVAYPHIGEEWKDKRWQFTNEPVPITDLVPDWISAGARWIGGCCETSLSDIQAVRRRIDSQ